MKIAIVSPVDLSIFLFCKELVKTLKNNNRNRIYIISDIYEGSKYGYYTNIIKTWDVAHIRIKLDRFINPLKDLRYIVSLYKILRTEQIDMVINIANKPNIYGSIAAKLANVKIIVCSLWGMGLAFSGKADIKSKSLRFLVLCLYQIAFRFSSKIWFTNEYDCKYFVSKGMVAPERVILTKNYVNTEEYSPSSISKEKLLNLRKELGLKDQDRVVIMVSRMRWTKGVKEFVDASEILRDRLPIVKFLLVGPKDQGSQDSVPESYLTENNKYRNFMWIGFRKDVKELYAISDLAVLPTYYREGGFPRGLTEPMSMGKPIITTNSVHCRGTVEEGRNGYLVPVKDSKALANAIENIVNDDNKREVFGRYSRLKAVNEFDEKVIIAEVVKEIFSI